MSDGARIGITCDFEIITDRRGCPAPRYVCRDTYVRAVQAAGGQAILLPFTDPALAARNLDLLDGLVLSGGDFDVPPQWYGQVSHDKLGNIMPVRSAFERALLEAALVEDRPVLAVCAGMQLLNVLRGGTLHQDLSLRPDTGVHEQPEDQRKPFHRIDIVEPSLLSKCLGETRVEINSTHHQVIDRVGEGLVETAVATDGVVEAIEDPDRRFVLGVQWHPESLEDPAQDGLYRGLVEAATQTSAH